MIQPQAELFDLYRAGLKTAADLMKASLESAERLQNQQLVAIKSLDELMALQTRLAGAHFERAMSYWGDLVQEQARWLSEATASAATEA